jgi:hypothetical protein
MEQLQTLEQHAADVRNHHVQDTQAEDSVRQEQLQTLEQHAADVRNHHVQDTQAEDSVRQEQFEKLNLDIEAVQRSLDRFEKRKQG